MDYYENVVIEYLRADRTLFVNTECCIQINVGENPDTTGPHWYCDAVVADFRSEQIFLCEISYANQLSGLNKRLKDWDLYWAGVRQALVRDNCLPGHWPVRPWLFVPEELVPKLLSRVEKIRADSTKSGNLPDPKITTLEMAQPWKYRSWNRSGESKKPELIPATMQ